MQRRFRQYLAIPCHPPTTLVVSHRPVGRCSEQHFCCSLDISTRVLDFPITCPSSLHFDGAEFGARAAVTELELSVVDWIVDNFVHQASREEILCTFGVSCHAGVSFGMSYGDGWSMVADGVGNPVETISPPAEVARIYELARDQGFAEWLIER